MLRTLLPFFLPVVITAGSINISLENHNGKSSYTVENAGNSYLKSELTFPFHFYSINLDYEHNFNNFDINVYSSFLLNNKTTTAEDSDWKNDKLTVYSQSDNTLDTYYNLGLTVSKDMYKNISLFSTLEYQKLNMSWSNTLQIDYVKDETTYHQANTLEYDQDFYQYKLGLKYKKNLSKDVSFSIAPSGIYAFINTKDIHILRDFYTKQNIQTFGYELDVNLKYKLTKASDIYFSANYINIEDKSTSMDYYNVLDEKYASYQSSYSYNNTILSFGYSYFF